MKEVLKIIGGIFLAAYVVVAIVLTVLLLNYNKYNVTEINGNTFIIVKDEELKPSFQKGDLVIVKRNAMKEVEIGDKIFFYDIYEGNVSVNLGTVVNKEEVTRKETRFIVDGDYAIPPEDFIGKASTSKVYSNWGLVISILESRFVFLFLIIFPILMLFIYEVSVLIREIKSPKEDE